MSFDHSHVRIAVVGASGGVGRQVIRQALARGYLVTAQTRSRAKLAELEGQIDIVEGKPADPARIAELVKGQDAVIFTLGIDKLGRTTLFSDATRVLIDAMKKTGVRRLIALTGVGAGETRGHGGWFYNHVIFPLFTRSRYADKDLQESLIEASGLEWTIVRPAPFNETQQRSPLQTVTRIGPDTQLSRIARPEVANFLLDQVESQTYIRQKPFIGHS
jgi:putative NADH-flavin reductase